MDKIDQRLDDLYKNWHAEYGSAATLEEGDDFDRWTLQVYSRDVFITSVQNLADKPTLAD